MWRAGGRRGTLRFQSARSIFARAASGTTVIDPEGDELWIKSVYREIVEPELIVYTRAHRNL
jgi:hypothetical protein